MQLQIDMVSSNRSSLDKGPAESGEINSGGDKAIETTPVEIDDTRLNSGESKPALKLISKRGSKRSLISKSKNVIRF
jgi:hypothetical protein